MTQIIESQSHSFLTAGWKDKVTLAAYAIRIPKIAFRENGAILQLLLQKHTSGKASKKIWNASSITAIINYHWDHWATPFLMFSLCVFVAWMFCFIFYMILYIVRESSAC